MNWRDFVPPIVFKASASTRAIVTLVTPGQPVTTPKNFAQLSREGYENNVTVYVCINEVAKAIAGLEWLLFQRQPRQVSEIEAHPLLDLLARPNPWEGQGKFIEKVVAYLMLSGNTYIEAVAPGGPKSLRPPKELYSLRPDRMTVIPHAVERIGGYEYKAGSQSRTFLSHEILHTKLFAPTDDWYGLSPITVASALIDSDNTGLRWNYNLIKNGARPSGAMVVSHNLPEAQFTRLKSQIDEEYIGADRAGFPMLLEGGMEWKEMGLSPKDLDWLEGRKDLRLEIARAYQIPPELIGLKEGTFENRKEAKRAFYTETVLPLADIFVGELNNWLTPRYGDNLYLDYDRDAIEALQDDRQKVWERVKVATWLTENEKRVATGYDEDARFDVWLVPATLLPMDAGTGARFDELPATDDDKTREPRHRKSPDLIDLAPDPARERLWKSFVRQFLPIELRYRAALQLYFQKQQQRALTALRVQWPFLPGVGQQSGHAGPSSFKAIADLLFELDDETDTLKAISRPMFEESMKRGGEAVWLEVGGGGAFGAEAPQALGRVTVQLSQVGRVAKSSISKVGRAIEAGLNNPEGAESVEQIAQRIRGAYTQLTEAQSLTIARTETARAYNEGRDTAMDNLGVAETEWLSARDEAVRSKAFVHVIDGEIRARGEAFSNGLRYPHDPNGEAGNVINCRCVALPAQRRR